MTIKRADTLDERATAYKGFFCDITGIPRNDVDEWITPSMKQNLSLVVTSRKAIPGRDIATFAERIKSTEWTVAGLTNGLHFLFKLPE